MLARLRCVRRRRLTLTTHPSHRSAERVASTTPPVPLFFPIIRPSAWGGSRTRATGLEGLCHTARLPTLPWGTRPRILESFLGSRLSFRGSLFQECLELVNRREEIMHVLALVLQIPRDSTGVRDRLFRQPLPRFLPEFGRLRPFHSSACHRPSRLTIVSPKSRRAYLARFSQRPRGDEESRLSTAPTPLRCL